MIALDTNVIVRFLVQDDERQARIAHNRLREAERTGETLFIPIPVALEAMWVLRSAYGRSQGEIIAAFEDLRGMPIMRFENDDVVRAALEDGKRGGANLADLLIAHSARARGCESGITFDKRASRLPFFRLLK